MFPRNQAMRKKLILYFKRRNHARKQWVSPVLSPPCHVQAVGESSSPRLLRATGNQWVFCPLSTTGKQCVSSASVLPFAKAHPCPFSSVGAPMDEAPPPRPSESQGLFRPC